MAKISKKALVPYTPDQMYDLVSNVEDYPEFLPWCDEVNILEREDMRIKASLGVRKGKINQAFTTMNNMVPGKRIEMNLVEGPFKKLHGVWHFSPRGDSGCEITLDMEFDFARGLLGYGFGKIFGGIANTMVDAFCQRARQLYG